MLPHVDPTPPDILAYRIVPLRWLVDELRARALHAHVSNKGLYPHLHASLPDAGGYDVTLSMRGDERYYVWGIEGATHPTTDPEGCARRIATALRGQREAS